jgi:hypothetical protein
VQKTAEFPAQIEGENGPFFGFQNFFDVNAVHHG